MSVKLALTAMLISGIIASVSVLHIKDGLAQKDSQNVNLTGMWAADDGGTYYIRSIANEVWWLGISGDDDGNTFSNVLKGRIHENNDTITAAWADIPRGSNEYHGTLTLSIDSDSALSKINETSYDEDGNPSCCFGAATWQR